MDLSQAQIAALDNSITPVRMSTFLTIAGDDKDRARDLYFWDRQLAVAFLADLAIVEVALRNARNTQLVKKWGERWYEDHALLLDERTTAQLHQAWRRIAGEKTPGRVVAECMFGFWRGLLDRGDHVGKDPRRPRCDYEILWRGVLGKAFPGGRKRAQSDGERWDRSYALRVVSRVNDLRNRVAHHEPLINGFPLTGQNRRRTAEEGHADILRLAAMLDRDLHSALVATSKVPAVLANRPL